MKKNIDFQGVTVFLLMLYSAVIGTARAQRQGPCDEIATYLYWGGGNGNVFLMN